MELAKQPLCGCAWVYYVLHEDPCGFLASTQRDSGAVPMAWSVH
jgi:hypothetical protein